MHPCRRQTRPTLAGPNSPPRCWVCRGDSALGSVSGATSTSTTDSNIYLVHLDTCKSSRDRKLQDHEHLWYYCHYIFFFVMCTFSTMSSPSSHLFDIHFYTPMRWNQKREKRVSRKWPNRTRPKSCQIVSLTYAYHPVLVRTSYARQDRCTTDNLRALELPRLSVLLCAVLALLPVHM